MSHLLELLSNGDAAALACCSAVLVFALVSAVGLLTNVAPALRRAAFPGAANTVTACAAVEIAALVATPILVWYCGTAELERFGAEDALPLVVGPAARAGLPMLVGLIAANVVAHVSTLRGGAAPAEAPRPRG